jgi:hypothetical protein
VAWMRRPSKVRAAVTLPTEIKVHALETSVLGGGEWGALRSVRFTSGYPMGISSKKERRITVSTGIEPMTLVSEWSRTTHALRRV